MARQTIAYRGPAAHVSLLVQMLEAGGQEVIWERPTEARVPARSLRLWLPSWSRSAHGRVRRRQLPDFVGAPGAGPAW